MTLGTRLRKCRETKRFSQKEVAEHIGVSQTTYCNWENETVSYQVKYLPLLAQLFEVNVLELIPRSRDAESLNIYSQHNNHAASSRNVVDANQAYTDLLKSKEEIIQLLREENDRLKELPGIGM